jgi:hypothetical protein
LDDLGYSELEKNCVLDLLDFDGDGTVTEDEFFRACQVRITCFVLAMCVCVCVCMRAGVGACIGGGVLEMQILLHLQDTSPMLGALEMPILLHGLICIANTTAWSNLLCTIARAQGDVCVIAEQGGKSEEEDIISDFYSRLIEYRRKQKQRAKQALPYLLGFRVT